MIFIVAIFMVGSAAASIGDWLKPLGDSPGLLFDEPDATYLQSVKIGSRFHWQAYAISGNDTNGNSFLDTGTEFRRFRPSIRVGLLKYFTLDASANLVSDRRFAGGETDWQFQNYDRTLVTFDAGKAFSIGDFDTLALSYGRQKLTLTSENLSSADRIITIERSALANTFFAGRYPTGFFLRLGDGSWLATFSYLNGFDNRSFDNSTPGSAWFASLDYTFSENWKLRADAFLNRFGSSTRSSIPFRHAASLNAIYDRDPFGLITTVAYGDNGSTPGGRGGAFGGIVIMPWFWIIPKKTQAVFQYSLLTSDQASAIRANSRYLAAAPTAINSRRGDELHTLYLGINQYLRGKTLRLMAGLEYANLHTPAGTVDSFTTTFAVRHSF
ncbi:MAG: hypothetical protein ACSHX9_11640 [Luteolibacter sp.]